jgi:hypothetical protein
MAKTPLTDKLPPTWQRLVLSVTGVLVIEGSWRWAVAHLYTLPTSALAGFVSITTNAFYVIGAIIIFMVTGKLVYEWKMGTQQVQGVQSLAEDVKEEFTERVAKPKHFDDDSIP